jgi:hypothetical protein
MHGTVEPTSSFGLDMECVDVAHYSDDIQGPGGTPPLPLLYEGTTMTPRLRMLTHPPDDEYEARGQDDPC